MTIEELVTEFAAQVPGPSTARSVAGTVARTALLNAITLPLGFMSVGVTRRASNEEIKRRILAALYAPTPHGWFNKPHKDKAALTRYLDGLPDEGKVTLIGMALRDPKAYAALVKLMLERGQQSTDS